MFELEKENQKIGEHLKKLIDKVYPSTRQFCKHYLEYRGWPANDDDIKRLENRFCQIVKGRKAIQTYDLPVVTQLLGVSCEEILSAGGSYAPIKGHVTNYEIAFSNDRAVWDKYMKREDKLFLNSDEYGKTVIDYALEFKNYQFIKYLMDEKFIWFVDLTRHHYDGYTYGAGTIVKRREISKIDFDTENEIANQDRLRTQTVALAIENKDTGVLDALRAREIPEFHREYALGYSGIDIRESRNEDLIKAVAFAEDGILDYFSDEFSIENRYKGENTFVFPYIDEVSAVMLQNKRKEAAVKMLQKAIRHNRAVFEKLKSLMDEAYCFYLGTFSREFDGMEKMAKNYIKGGYSFDSDNGIVSYHYSYSKNESKGMASNVIYADVESDDPNINALVDELNDTYNLIASINEEEN